ncbi:RidA family protein [Mesorhizobium xinjiangense]|uniref:RidA family protein n=1 Tax=Mesorhizobium xinjiangense TaxID=2678685 RepID=UPI0012ECCFC0|nr:RidA family protein [Mesorhizobium xinjiangense]
MSRQTIIPTELEAVYANWHFAPAVISNGMIYCSGIIGTSADGQAGDDASAFDGVRSTLQDSRASLSDLKAVDDPEQQFSTAFEVLAAILAEAGAGLGHVVELVTYHVEIRRYMDTFVKIKDRYIGEPYPAWTAVGVSELIVPGGLVELRAVAAKDN